MTGVPLRSQVTVPRTSLVGRERDLEAVLRILDSPSAGVVTLTGPGGVGKTRLALAVALAHAERRGIASTVVELAPLNDPSQALGAILAALGIPVQDDRPAIDTLSETLADTSLLLVLDNLEHLRAAAGSFSILSARLPRLVIVATSRVPLHIEGEREYPVAPLPFSNEGAIAGDLLDAPAIRLFVERAQAVRPDFEVDDPALLAAVCARLDGLPLAIELAAAWVKLFSLDDLLHRLERRLDLLVRRSSDRPQRHQTMRATIGWSYDLLSERPRRAFRRLAVFAGGCSLAAAEAVCSSPDLTGSLVTDALAALIDASLLQPHAGPASRLRLLETVREYATERLDEAGEADQARDALLDWCLTFAEEGDLDLSGPGRAGAMQRLSAEQDNFRAALAWARDSRDDRFLRLASALGLFWGLRGLASEGRRWLEAALAGHQATDPIVTKAQSRLGMLAFLQGANAEASALLDEAVAAWRRLDSPRELGIALGQRGLVAAEQNDYALAEKRCGEAVATLRAAGERWSLAWVLTWAAEIALRRGANETAERTAAEALGIYRRLDDRWGIAESLLALGRMVLARGQYDAAAGYLNEGLVAFEQAGDVRHVATTLLQLGNVANARGDHAMARDRFARSLAISEEIGDRAGIAWSRHSLAVVAQHEGDLAAATHFYDESVALFDELGDLGSKSLSLNGLGDLARSEGRLTDAERFYRNSLALAKQLGHQSGTALVLRRLGYVALRQGRLDEARERFDAGYHGALEVRRPLSAALCLVGLAGVLGRAGNPLAARALGATDALLDDAALSPVERAEYLAIVRSIRERLPERRFDDERRRGRRLDHDSAFAVIRQALEGGRPPALPLTEGLLTRREHEVLRLVSLGWTDAEIAGELQVSPRTVGSHLRLVYDKLNVHTRTAAVRAAQQAGLLDAQAAGENLAGGST